MWSHVNIDPDHDPHIQQKTCVFYLEDRGVVAALEMQRLEDLELKTSLVYRENSRPNRTT